MVPKLLITERDAPKFPRCEKALSYAERRRAHGGSVVRGTGQPKKKWPNVPPELEAQNFSDWGLDSILGVKKYSR